MKKTTQVSGILLGALLLAGAAAPAFAHGETITANLDASASGSATSISVSADATLISRADTEITKRIADLNAQNARIQSMNRLSVPQKATFAASINTQISTLATLKAKIDGEAGDQLKADTKSITGAYRIYLLVIPQGRVLAAADRALTVTDTFATLSIKLQARITSAQAAGKDVTASQAALADMNAKVADAKVQAQAAIDLTATLTPDNKDTAKMQANETAIKNARIKLKTSEADLKETVKDAVKAKVSYDMKANVKM